MAEKRKFQVFFARGHAQWKKYPIFQQKKIVGSKYRFYE